MQIALLLIAVRHLVAFLTQDSCEFMPEQFQKLICVVVIRCKLHFEICLNRVVVV